MRGRLQLRPVALGVMLALSGAAAANPVGPQVAAGSATFNTAGKTLTVTNTPGAILNWQSFSIGAGELTRFQQQSALSAVLNRVTGANPSSILGTLSSNGRVFLINPHGIVFGQGSVINTAGFVASTLNMRDEDFLAGRMKFEGGGHGALRSEGAIRASGDIFLVGPQIENAGLIKSDNGSVLLAAGQSVTITSPDAHGVQFALQAPTDAAINLGAIEAKNAAAMFAGTLKHSGDILATSASVDASGRVILAAQKDAIVDGNATISVDNSAGKGGSVQITGERVGLFDNAAVSARGATGGGEILVGGDFQGKNPDIRNAARTYVAKDATLRADAIANGDGGKVIVWADDVTRYFGHASVQGGTLGGNGGLIEISGKNVLVFDGTVGLEAMNGRGGRLLLDPLNITVLAGAGTLDGFLSVPGDPLLAFAEPDNFTSGTLNVASLQAFTTGTVELQANNDITFGAAVTMQPGVSLKAAAMNNVNVNANITTSGGGALLLEADTDLSGAGRVNLAAVTIDAPLTIGKVGVPLSGNATVTGNAILAQDVQVLGSLALPAGRTLTINTGKTLTVAGGMTADTGFFAPATITGGGTLEIPAAQTLLFTSNDSQSFSFDNVTVNNAGIFQLNGTTGAHTVMLNNGAVFNNQAGGQILFSQPGNVLFTNTGTGTLNNSGTIAASGVANATLQMGVFNANDGSIFSAVGGSVVRNAGSSTYNGNLTLNSALRLAGGTHVFADGVTLNGTGSLVHDGATTVTMNNVTANVPYALTSGDTLTLAAGKTLTVAGGMTADTGFFLPSTITGGGTLEIPVAQTLLFTSNDSQFFHLNNVTVNNAGTFQLNGSTSNNAVVLNNGAVFNNQTGGQILFSQPGNTLGTSVGIGTLNNSGTISASGVANATLSMSVFNANDGSIFTTGTGSVIRSAGSSSYDGNLTLNSALRLTGGTHVFADGVTLNGTGSVVHDNATVTMNNVTANVPYALAAGRTLTLAAGKTLTVAGGMTADTGFFLPSTITGGGTLEIPAAQTLLFNSNDSQFFHFNNVTVNNAGTFQLNGSTGNNAAVLNNNAVFNNQPGGQILFSQPGNTLGTSVGIGTLNNSGTIASSGGNNATLSMSVFNANDGSIFDVGAGSVIRSLGSSSYDGNLTLNSALRLTGGTHVFADGVTLNGTGSVVHDNATVTMNNVTANVPYELVAGRTLTLAAGKTLTVSGGMTVNTGFFLPSTITGGGTLEIPAAQTLLFNSNDSQFFHFNNVTVNNAGTFQLNGSTSNNAVVLNNGAVFNNQTGGQILFSQPGNTLGTSSGTGTLNNSGTIAAAGGDIAISVAVVTNSGLLDVTAGNASIPSGLALLAGSIDVGVGRNVSIGGTGLDWQGGTLTGVGTYTLSSLTITGSGARVLDGPTFAINDLILPGGSLAVQSGALNLSGDTSIAAGATLAFSGGALNLGGALNNDGVFDVNAGVFNLGNGGNSSGTFDAAPSATINFSGGTHDLADGSALSGGGNFAYTGGTLNINGGTTGTTVDAGSTLSANGQTFGGAGKLINLGTFNLANSTVSGSIDNQGTFNASGVSAVNGTTLDLTSGTLDLAAGGTLTKGGGAVNWIGSTITGTGALTGAMTFTGGGARVINGPIFNLGVTTLPAGTLTIQGGALNFSGIATIANGATLDVAGGIVTGALAIDVQGLLKMSGGVLNAASVGLVPGGTLSGTGTVNAPVVNGGTVTVGASPGTLIINGNYAQTPVGILDIELGGTTQGVNYDLLQVTGTAALDGTLNVALFGGFVGAAGNVFDVLTYASRSGDFATKNFPAGYTMSATPNAALYQLAMNAVPGGGGGGGGSGAVVSIDTEFTPPATEVKILNDKFISAALDPGKPAEDEEKKGAVLECK